MMTARSDVGAPTLYPFSPSVVPKPADWNPTDHVTGYWFANPPAEWQPPADLAAFLAAGPPPVYVGFGSIPMNDAERLAAIVLRALASSGQRGIVLVGRDGLARLTAPKDVILVDDVPHHWLFPKVAAVVHHGGAGTTGAGLRAGVPAVILPRTFDQFAWAAQAASLGAALSGGYLQSIKAEALAALISRAVTDPQLRARAAALGKSIRAETGIANAIGIIERHAEAFRAMRAGRAA
jgi:UDP:flavonoid glycosyltransferase YjiC (YdhE family)